MESNVLVFAPGWDLHAAAAVWGLQESGHMVCWSRTGSVADAAVGALAFHTDGQKPVSLTSSGTRPFPRSVWFRRARDPAEFPGSAACDEVFLRDEWTLFQRNVWALAEHQPGTFWVNGPAAARRAENKLVQLDTAIACGLRVPPTVVTNDPAEVASFRARHRNVIYKPFSLHSWVDAQGRHGGVAHARLITPDLVLDEASVRLCPGIYQAFVEKAADVRVTVIGNRWFAVRLGKRQGNGFVDWRSHATADDFHAEPFALPGPVWDRLRDFMGRLDLAYGAFDLVLDTEGGLHFLEVNQGGQFLFVERWLPSQPLLQAMCAMLAAGGPDYPMESRSVVSYANFRASEWCTEWREHVRAHPPLEQEMRFGLTVEPCAA